jgi:hypothetical protein
MKINILKRVWWMVQGGVLLGLFPAAHAQERFDPRDGWRSAYVLQAISATASHHLVSPANDCRTRLDPAARHDGAWVLLRYRRVPGDVYRIAQVAAGEAIAGGQAVQVNVNRCEALHPSHGTPGQG